MAFPRIRFERDLGYDYDGASGAGPDPPLTGTNAYNYYSTNKFGLFDFPDLSGVATDGSHALKLGTASGCQWFKIVAKKETFVCTTGDMDASSVHVTNISDTSGMANNDLIRIVGAGVAGVDLYTEIQTIVSATEVDCYTAASTTVVAATVDIPPWVTSNSTKSISAGTYWAIGGKRDDPAQAVQLWLDMDAGWEVEFIHSELESEIAATITLSKSGSSTDGKIRIFGTAIGTFGTGKPVLKGASGFPFFTVTGDLYEFDELMFDSCSDGILLSNSAVKDVLIKNCDSIDCATLVRAGNQVVSGRLHLIGCSADNGALVRVQGILSRVTVDGCYHHDQLGTRSMVKIESATPVSVFRCILNTSYDGIDLGSSSSESGPSNIEECTFYNSQHDCVFAGHVSRCKGIVIRNNIFDAGLYHIELPANGSNVACVLDYNAHLGSVKLSNCVLGEHSIVTSSALGAYWRNAKIGNSLQDFRIGLPLRALGWPRGFPGSASPTLPFVDLGAVQRQEPAGGSIITRVIGMSDTGSSYIMTYICYTSTPDEYFFAGSVEVAKNTVSIYDVVRPELIQEIFRAYMRDGNYIEFPDLEILG